MSPKVKDLKERKFVLASAFFALFYVWVVLILFAAAISGTSRHFIIYHNSWFHHNVTRVAAACFRNQGIVKYNVLSFQLKLFSFSRGPFLQEWSQNFADFLLPFTFLILTLFNCLNYFVQHKFSIFCSSNRKILVSKLLSYLVSKLYSVNCGLYLILYSMLF